MSTLVCVYASCAMRELDSGCPLKHSRNMAPFMGLSQDGYIKHQDLIPQWISTIQTVCQTLGLNTLWFGYVYCCSCAHILCRA